MAGFQTSFQQKLSQQQGAQGGSTYSQVPMQTVPTTPVTQPAPIPAFPTSQVTMPAPAFPTTIGGGSVQVVQPGQAAPITTAPITGPMPQTPAPNPVVTETQKAWDEYLKADPFYTQTTGQLSAQGQTDAAERARQIQQALIMFGEIPTGLESPDITDVTRQAAQEATDAGLSTVARLQKAAADARRNAIAGLRARGLLRSGETGYQLGELGLQSNQAQYDARQSLLDFISGRQYDFNQSELGRGLANIQAQFEAAQRGLARGVGPLVPGFGEDLPKFVLNPIRQGGALNSIPGPAPAGMEWSNANGNLILQPTTAPPGFHYVSGQLVPLPAAQITAPGGTGLANMQDFINAWGA